MTKDSGLTLDLIAVRLTALEQKISTVNVEPGALGRLDAARFLGISPRKFDDILYRGGIKSRLIGTRRLVLIGDLRKYLASDHPEAATPRKAPRKRTEEGGAE
ncbi:MAG: hypothetical protein ACRD13_13330 [Terriglobales bacterium]